MRKTLGTICITLIILAATFLYFSRVQAPAGRSSENNIDLLEEANTQPPEAKTTFVFAGDMMFDRYVNHVFKNIGFDRIFDNLDKSLFADKNIAFANLEGPVSDQAIVDDFPERTLVFDMPPETIPTLNNLGINAVSLANNHTLNAGAGGFTTAKSLLAAANIKYAGSQNGFDASNIMEFNADIPVSIICVDYLAYSNNDNIVAAIKSEKAKGNFVIVFPHWGEEYSLTHTAGQENAAKRWIDGGADLVIGSHPHVIEDVGIYKDKPIIYSMGNFVFDQTFSADTQQGLILTGAITETSLELTIHPIESVKLKPQLASDTLKSKILKRIINASDFGSIMTSPGTFKIAR